jgi:hypothetical protein
MMRTTIPNDHCIPLPQIVFLYVPVHNATQSLHWDSETNNKTTAANQHLEQSTSAQSTDQPNLLTRVWGSTHYLWQMEKEVEFMEWWKTTEYSKGTNSNCGSKKRKADKTSFWSHFDECANATTREPGLYCRTCHELLINPNIRQYGNSAPCRHMWSCCTSARVQSGSVQQSLINMVAKV